MTASVSSQLSLLLITCTLTLTSCQNVKEFVLTVQHGFRFPDGFKRRVVLVNDAFSSPEIRVNKGDTVRVTFKNSLTSDVFTVHWHGLTQKNSQWQDGVYLGTQCSIPTADEYTYEFVADEEPGTYFYHGHQGMLRIEGLQGPFIIEDPPNLKARLGYDEEFTMMIMDLYHEEVEFQLLDLLQPFGAEVPPGFIWVGNPDTFIINGKGYWNATGQDVSETEFDQSLAQLETYTVKPNQKYMFRIISGTSLSYTSVWIQDHNMTVVRVDGKLVKPFEVASVEVNSGERYDVIVEANQPIGYYWIQMEIRYREPVVQGWALLKYVGAQGASGSIFEQPTAQNPVGMLELPQNPKAFFSQEWDPRTIKGLETLEGDMAQLYPSRTLFLGGDAKVMKFNNSDDNNYFRWAISANKPQVNSQTYEVSESPLMTILAKNRCDLVGPHVLIWPDVCNGEEDIKLGEVIDIVFQNYPIFSGKVDEHPWHLHGYSFYVLGYGAGEFSYEEHKDELNLVDPPLRDTITVYPSVGDEIYLNGVEPQGVDALTPSGWTVVRFKANNPGVWNLHCHITWHLFSGMEMFIVEELDMIPEPPTSLPECGPVRFYEE
eukprot:TRINITY_DN908_c0_g1_i1.p1 TRINITY_DN908_c0_g1~~TRINITY_DN908_c0_g1_i1.p1  ORF type:complete len:614 (-),score=61.40 TRINITY_DN908_c0_g1_i1:403-2205(-)